MDDVRVAFSVSLNGARGLPDESFLAAVQWAASARRSVVTAAESGDPEIFSRKLQKLGFGTKGAKTDGPAASEEQLESLWSCGTFAETPHTAGLLAIAGAILGGKPRKRSKMADRRKKSNRRGSPSSRTVSPRRAGQLAEWLETVAAVEHEPSPFELQVLFELLCGAGRGLPAEVFWPLWRAALTTAIALGRELDELPQSGPTRGAGFNPPDWPVKTGPTSPAGSRVRSGASEPQRLMILGELPWQSGLLFSDVAGAGALREFGRRQLLQQLEENTDTDGTPRAELLDCLSGWLAPLVRAAGWARAFGAELWDDEGRERFRALLGVVTSMCRPDGHFTLNNGHGAGRSAAEAARGSARRAAVSGDTVSLLQAASRLAGLKAKSQPLRYLLAVAARSQRGKREKATGPKKGTGKKGFPVTQSDWARVACLRSGWSVDADTLVVAHHREMPVIELTALGRPLLSGTWHLEASVDGKPLQFVDQWTCTCWHSDEDADYLELQQSLEGGVQVERQLLLSRTDRFALLADAVSGTGRSPIDYRSRLPVVGGFSVEADVPTRECRLRTKGFAARLFPLALPEDRVMSTPGEFGPAASLRETSPQPQPDGLELQQAGMGGLYAPLIIDWHPDRRRREAEWRTLTVSEQRRAVKPDTAGAHRLRIGRHHLLVYRSLHKPAVPRTFLGQHTSNETVVGQLDRQGELSPILLVQ